MVKSMTGFGRGEHIGKVKQIIVEIKAVNHRYGEVQIKIPRQYSSLEEPIKKYILNNISRGRIEAFIKVEETGNKARKLMVDKDLALAYYKVLREVATITETSFDIGVAQLVQFPEVLELEESEEEMKFIWEDMLPALHEAMLVLVEMREKEGQELRNDLIERVDLLQRFHGKIKEKSVRVVEIYREKLAGRLKEILEEGKIDQDRLTMEVAIFAERCNIDEELVRLDSHFIQFTQSLDKDTAVGRKLDFLVQEMNREVNTIGAKANDLEITNCVVEMKSELEKIREQVQNIE
ncbi:MAG: YicC family protein [Clostridia bacterium]|nr:YicC family protein [Clostridia bacterium]MDD4048669.1 YicC family protein [Clostridia bacterium]